MSINTGGWAFPVPNSANVNREEGMTLRDYFAAKAMQGMYANSCDDYTFKSVSADAYATADAMLAERAKAQTAQEGWTT